MHCDLHNTFAHLWVPFSLGVSQNKRISCIERTKTAILFFETNMYMKHHLSEPDVPLTDLHHISAIMQVSSVEPSAISANAGTRNWEQAEDVRLPTYIDRQR